MLQWFKHRSEAGRTAEELYGRVVAAARQERFYRQFGVADTPEGRFELVALHLFLALESINPAGARSQTDVVQRTLEAFVTDMDDCMREMGVGDLTVPKKVRRAAGAFYERAGVYRMALSQAVDDDLIAALRRFVFAGQSGAADVRSLANYVRATVSRLSGRGPQDVFQTLG